MAMVQIGRAALLIGVGVIAASNPKVAVILAELQGSAREKGADAAGSGEAVAADAAAEALQSQIAMLARDVRQLAYNNAVIQMDMGNGGVGSALILPVAAVGAVSYCYMWWNGITFSSLMYVTKRNMANAVASMTKHLEQVQGSLAAAKKHLSQRIQHVDDKLEQQKEISGQIKDQVTGAKLKIKNIGSDMDKIKNMVIGLDEKMDSIEAKQSYSCAAVDYLCKFIEQRGQKLPERLEGLQRTVRQIGYNRSELPGLGFGQLLTIESASPGTERIMLRSTSISSARLILP
ncbi:uncharacterized protein LOC120672799 [Panicum virgatum]|uniref:DUF1664 domain-containing protein n=1 Tax=Panicum virgatum TaxID=38727 RepID=A0A8T0RKI0_PANVG|nr:uncharacterized protein LOC120672799 [Panicum virgatum]KAG2586507.1 hypothetical protein PVAP13_5NG055000 [Panicum virgatum]